MTIAVLGVFAALLAGCGSETTSPSTANSPEATFDGPRPADVPGYEMAVASDSETGFAGDLFRNSELRFEEANQADSEEGRPERYLSWSNWRVTKPGGEEVGWMTLATVDPAALPPAALAENVMKQMAELATAHGEALEPHSFSDGSANGGGFFAGTSYAFSMTMGDSEIRLLSAYPHQRGMDAVIAFADAYVGTALQ